MKRSPARLPALAAGFFLLLLAAGPFLIPPSFAAAGAARPADAARLAGAAPGGGTRQKNAQYPAVSRMALAAAAPKNAQYPAVSRRRRTPRRALAAAPKRAPRRARPAPARMVLVPAGWFLMGSDTGGPDTRPRRRVWLDAFYIDKYPVTNADFGEPEEDYGPGFRGPGQPAVGVNWFLARDFCRAQDKRLPTEAEWEKAARGPAGLTYPWGDTWSGGRLIWGRNSRGRTHPVKRKYRQNISPYGARDMAGHIWEWVADRYGERYYQTAPARNPKGPKTGAERVLRGGSWALRHRKFFQAFHRTAAFPTVKSSDAGFRCAKSAKP